MNKLTPLLLVLLCAACKSSKITAVATSGSVSPAEFTKQIPFRYEDKHIFIPIEIEGTVYSFLFDTGWEVTSLSNQLAEDVPFTRSLRVKTSGSSFATHYTQYGFLDALTIADITFADVGMGMEDLYFTQSGEGADEPAEGILGNNIMRNAYWQINFQTQVITVSHQLTNLPDFTGSMAVPMQPRMAAGWGNRRVEVQLNDVTEAFVFDTGSSGGFTSNPSLLDRLTLDAAPASVQALPLESDSEIQRYKLHQITVGDSTVLPEINIEPDVASLMGNDFLEDYLVTIDFAQNILYLRPY